MFFQPSTPTLLVTVYTLVGASAASVQLLRHGHGEAAPPGSHDPEIPVQEDGGGGRVNLLQFPELRTEWAGVAEAAGPPPPGYLRDTAGKVPKSGQDVLIEGPLASSPELQDSASIKYLLALDAENAEVNCTTVEHLWTLASENPMADINGTDFSVIEQECKEGKISSVEDVVAELARRQAMADLSLEDQLKNTAREICAKDLTQVSSNVDVSAITAECNKDPWDAKAVVHAATLAQAHHSGHDTSDDLEETCKGIEKNRDKIEGALLALAASERRLKELQDVPTITGAEIGTDMVTMYGCLCDKTNPDNKGCLEKTLRFVEDVGASISEQAKTDFEEAESAQFMGDLHSSLEKHTRHYGGSESSHHQGDNFDLNSATALSETGVGKCDPPGVMYDDLSATFSLCIYAGVVDCSVSWSWLSPACLSFGCGAGTLLKFQADLTACPLPPGYSPSCNVGEKCSWEAATFTLNLSMCIDAVSSVLAAIGKWIPGAESLMNRFNIYGGCYRLGEATYDPYNNRMEIIVGPLKQWVIFNVAVEVGGHARFRFKGYGYPYQDDDWWGYEHDVKYVPCGDMYACGNDVSTYSYLRSLYKKYIPRGWKTSGWAQFGFRLRVYLDWWWWTTEVYSFNTGFVVSTSSTTEHRALAQ